MRNPKRLLVAAVTIAGLTGGAMVAHADPFRTRAYENTATTGDVLIPQNLAFATPAPQSLPSTCTLEQRDADACNVSLVAGVGQADITDGGSVAQVPFWGFGVNGADPALAGATGSVIKVPQGTVIHLTLTQQAGTAGPIDLTFPSLATVVNHHDGTYDVTADRPGTMLFEPGAGSSTTGLDAPRQIAMGMVGVLIVTPATASTPGVDATDTSPAVPAVPGTECTSCAYDINTPYADEALVALSTLDATFASDPSGDLSYFGQPRDAQGDPRKVYHVINGKAFPDTDVIDVREGDGLLLRYVNAGLADVNMGLLGLRQSVLGANTDEYDDPHLMVAPRVGPGETLDAAVAIPTGVAEGQKYSLMDQGRGMNGATAEGFGGALTFIDVWTGSAPTLDAPVFQAPSTVTATAHPSPTHAITAYQTLVTDSDVPPADGDWPAATPLDPAPAVDTPADISATVVATPGQYIWVRAQQDTGLWTAPAFVQAFEAPTVTIDSISASSERTVIFTATPPAGATIALVEAGFGTSTTPPTAWDASITDGATPDKHVVSGADHHGEEVWVRATDSNGHVSAPAHMAIPLDTPTIVANSLAFDGTTLTLSGAGTVDAKTTGTVQWIISDTPPDNNTVWNDGTSPVSAISESIPTAVNGNTIWVRIIDADGGTSAPESVLVAIP